MSEDFKLLAKLAADTSDFDSAMKRTANESKQWAAEAKAIFLSTRTPIERHQAAVEKVHDAWRTGRIDSDTFGRAIHKLRTEFEAISGEAQTATTKIDQFKALALKGAGAIGIGLGVSAAVSQLKQFAADSFREYQEAFAAQQKLDAVLRSTGHAAGFTADQLGDYATQLQRVSNFDDDAVTSAMAVLATFKQIQGEQFTEATRAILDLSAVMGQDLQSSAVQLGKALNDPTRGLTALRRVGVSFTREQEDLIKSFVKTNDVVSAQKVILAELESEFGGAAENMRSAAVGLGNDWRNLQESIGSLSDTSSARAGMDALAESIRDVTDTINAARAAAESGNSFGARLEGMLHGLKLAPGLGLNPLLNKLLGDEEIPKPPKPEALPTGAAKKATGKSPEELATEEADKLTKTIDALAAETKKQIDTLGMSANEAKLYALAQRAAGDAAAEAAVAEIRASMKTLETMQAKQKKLDDERAARAALNKSVDDYLKSLATEAQMVGKSAAEQDLLRFAIQGVREERLKDIEAAQKQAAASKRTAEAMREFFDMVNDPKVFNDIQAEERAKEQKEFDDLQAEFAAIADRHKSAADKANEKFKAEMKHLNELKEKGLAPDLYIEEFKAINKRHNEGLRGDKDKPYSSENRAILAGTAEAFSAVNRANDRKRQDKIAEDHLAVAKREEILLRQMENNQRNVQVWQN